MNICSERTKLRREDIPSKSNLTHDSLQRNSTLPCVEGCETGNFALKTEYTRNSFESFKPTKKISKQWNFETWQAYEAPNMGSF